MAKVTGVGVLGLGTVGSGVAYILLREHDRLLLETGLDIRLVGIATLYPDEKLVLRDTGEPIHVPAELISTDGAALIDRDDVDVVVELIGGIEPARTFVLQALAAGKSVVTANKKLLAECGEELYTAAEASGACINFEASTGASIPIIASVRDGLIANSISSMVGILNGTTNFILTEMIEKGSRYDDVLAEAQAKGYAETPPTMDVGGFDPAHKLCIMASLCFRQMFSLDSVYIEGIENVKLLDIKLAAEFSYTLKLLSIARRHDDRVELRVHPALVPHGTLMAGVNGTLNAVFINSNYAGPTMLCGHGAGQLPTASAVVADIVDIARGTAKIVFKNPPVKGAGGLSVMPMEEITTSYYVRFTAKDQPGMLGNISTCLSECNVSIKRVIQKQADAPKAMTIAMTTHSAKEADFRAALKKIDASDWVVEPSVFYRMEENDS